MRAPRQVPDTALPTATYRIQLRGGVDFAAVQSRVPYLRDLGISHIYLSPIFSAVPGSTHGYDVTDPNRIEDALGGYDGFAALSDAAHAAGLGVIIDTVPNHTAFVPQNPWLEDVLRHGQSSHFARHFDIDWAKGPLRLPFLGGPFEAVVDSGDLGMRLDDAGGWMTYHDLALPLAPGTAPSTDDVTPDVLRAVHGMQHWKLVHWVMERDAITHRRFFNVTGLIGMRVEDEAVFGDMHRLTFELVDDGLVDGIRLDHVDGLADPATYLARLARRLPATPIWVEKILTGDEPLPDWPVLGTTGYEAGRMIARVLTDADGLARLDAHWRDRTRFHGDFHATLDRAKGEVIRRDLSAELLTLVRLARDAADLSRAEFGDETLREAVIALLTAFPRYRTYGAAALLEEAPGGTGRRNREADAAVARGDIEAAGGLSDVPWMNDADRALMAEVAERAGEDLRSPEAVHWLAGVIAAPAGDDGGAAARRLAVRFQQTTGALLAKAHEDTAGFRYNRLLAANEVGAEPDTATLDAAGFADALADRALTQPHGITLTSSHDTKRSGDARARLIAVSHLPDIFAGLFDTAPPAGDVGANLRWYIVQSALAIWQPEAPDLADRLVAHVTKAMREAKVETNWSHPDEEAEAAALDWTRTLIDEWRRAEPGGLRDLTALGATLSLWQRALALAMPGIPDIYQGTEAPMLALTDPDNRRPVAWEALPDIADAPGLAGAKVRLTRALLQLRRSRPALFAGGAAGAERAEDGALVMRRSHAGATLTLRCGPPMTPQGQRIWPDDDRDAPWPLSVDLDAPPV